MAKIKREGDQKNVDKLFIPIIYLFVFAKTDVLPFLQISFKSIRCFVLPSNFAQIYLLIHLALTTFSCSCFCGNIQSTLDMWNSEGTGENV